MALNSKGNVSSERASSAAGRNQGRRHARVVPARNALGALVQVVCCQGLHDHEGVDEHRRVVSVGVIVDRLVSVGAVLRQRLQSGAKNATEVGFKRLKRGRSVSHLSIINECTYGS